MMFNNNSAQMLQNSQSRYETRQSSQGQNASNNSTGTNPSQNIFSNSSQNTGQNIFSNQSSSQNIFTGQNTTQNILSNQNNKNIFSNQGSTQNSVVPGYQANIQAQFRDYSRQQELLKVVNQMHQLQQDQDLFKLIRLVELINLKAEATMNRATKDSEAIAKESSENAKELRRNIEKRCFAIKERNSFILQELLNFRKKLMQKVYQWKVIVPNNEIEMERLTEKIKQNGAQIKNKMRQYHIQKQFNSTAPKKAANRAPFRQPLEELMRVTQKLGKETLQLHEEFSLFTQFLRGEPI